MGIGLDVTLWTNFVIQTAIIGFLTSGIFGALAGYALASAGGYRPWIGSAVGGCVPVLGVLALAIAFVARAPRQASRASAEGWWVTSRAGLLSLLAVGALAALLASCLYVGWFTFRFSGVPSSTLGVWGSPIGVMIVVSIFVLALAALLGLRRPSRLAGTAVAAIGSVWLFLSGSTIALRASVLQLAASVEAMKVSSYDFLTLLTAPVDRVISGLDPTSSSESSVGSDLALQLGLHNSSLSFGSVRLELGPAWYCLLAFAAGSIAWSWLVLRAANRASRSTTAAPDAVGVEATPTVVSDVSIWRQ